VVGADERLMLVRALFAFALCACSSKQATEAEFVQASDDVRIQLSLFKAEWHLRAGSATSEILRTRAVPELDHTLASLAHLVQTAKSYREAVRGDDAAVARLGRALDGIARTTATVQQARDACNSLDSAEARGAAVTAIENAAMLAD
jgi:hypothetical protein